MTHRVIILGSGQQWFIFLPCDLNLSTINMTEQLVKFHGEITYLVFFFNYISLWQFFNCFLLIYTNEIYPKVLFIHLLFHWVTFSYVFFKKIGYKKQLRISSLNKHRVKLGHQDTRVTHFHIVIFGVNFIFVVNRIFKTLVFLHYLVGEIIKTLSSLSFEHLKEALHENRLNFNNKY